MSEDAEGRWAAAEKEMRGLKGKWLFRGDTAGVLQTGLERACAAWPAPRPDPAQAERRLLADFRRRYPGWSTWAPPDSDSLAWTALMQHYGAPTRLLDCTYSPFIAAYFALQKLLMSAEPRAFVWAFRTSWFSQVHGRLPSNRERDGLDRVANNHDGEAFEELFLRAEPIRFVYPVNPRTMNERLVLQQGVFLCPGDVTASFADNLGALDGVGDRRNFVRIELPRSVLAVGLHTLLRMNLDAATLFPGLQGYAESLRTRVAFLGDTGG